MTFQKKYKITLGNGVNAETLEVYAFDVKGALYVVSEMQKEEPSIKPVTKVELVKETNV